MWDNDDDNWFDGFLTGFVVFDDGKSGCIPSLILIVIVVIVLWAC